jgi:hypothetical protein
MEANIIFFDSQAADRRLLLHAVKLLSNSLQGLPGPQFIDGQVQSFLTEKIQARLDDNRSIKNIFAAFDIFIVEKKLPHENIGHFCPSA